MITWKCLYKLDREELYGIVNDIKNGNSYTVIGWEDTYPTDNQIIDYAKKFGINQIQIAVFISRIGGKI